MTTTDTYKTIRKPSDGIYKEKGSRFLSFVYPVQTRQQAENHIMELKKKYHDARHHCFAYILNPDQAEYRVSDDGEPSNSAGQPILGQIRANRLTNVLIVVVRYFGGTLLGVGGLTRAYKSAAADAIDHADIITKTVMVLFRIRFPYDLTNTVMKVIQSPGIKVLGQTYDARVNVEIGVRKSVAEHIRNTFQSIQGVDIEYIDTG